MCQQVVKSLSERHQIYVSDFCHKSQQLLNHLLMFDMLAISMVNRIFMINYREIIQTKIIFNWNPSMSQAKFIFTTFIFTLLFAACTPSATVEFNPETAISLSVVEDLQFSNTDDLSIPDCVQRFEDINSPQLVTEGEIVPADFVIYIDLDPVYIGWETLPMEALCVKGNWGVFRTTGIVEIPDVEASIWSIDVDT